MEIDLWPLDHVSGILFCLTNRTGADARDVEVKAFRAMLDRNGKSYVRCVPSVANGESFQIRLNRVGLTTQPELEITWLDRDDERVAWRHRLDPYI
ncbi:hypothetical protein [Mycolicibacterium gadium]|uniref:hypothetical protein n=1 Tax=Mycolicibacterium gadium TaxID=1794 RepID=UPI0013D81B1B|nr:hypothetical protein [Mycolicibacterium gadium]